MLTRIILASASPRRLDLLTQVGLRVLVQPADVAEEALPGESPRELVTRLAECKGRCVAGRQPHDAPPFVTIAADTAVVAGGRILGKPRDREDAESMLRSLRGKSHEVWSGLFLLRSDDDRQFVTAETSRVTFRDFSDAALQSYVATGEPMDKAGAYGLQGRGALLVRGVEGSWSNVVGLPLERFVDGMDALGIDLARLIGR